MVGCSGNEEHFLIQEGVFILLDCLQTHPISMKSVILGVLVDLSDDTRCIPHLQAWQAREGNRQKLDVLQTGMESISDTLHLSGRSLGRNGDSAVGTYFDVMRILNFNLLSNQAFGRYWLSCGGEKRPLSTWRGKTALSLLISTSR